LSVIDSEWPRGVVTRTAPAASEYLANLGRNGFPATPTEPSTTDGPDTTVEIGTHNPDASRIRTGSEENSVVNDPSGFTNVTELSVSRPVTSTRDP